MVSVMRDDGEAMQQCGCTDEKVHRRKLLACVEQRCLNFAEWASHIGRYVENNSIVEQIKDALQAMPWRFPPKHPHVQLGQRNHGNV